MPEKPSTPRSAANDAFGRDPVCQEFLAVTESAVLNHPFGVPEALPVFSHGPPGAVHDRAVAVSMALGAMSMSLKSVAARGAGTVDLLEDGTVLEDGVRHEKLMVNVIMRGIGCAEINAGKTWKWARNLIAAGEASHLIPEFVIRHNDRGSLDVRENMAYFDPTLSTDTKRKMHIACWQMDKAAAVETRRSSLGAPKGRGIA